jgi:hypothetical protein
MAVRRAHPNAKQAAFHFSALNFRAIGLSIERPGHGRALLARLAGLELRYWR